MYCAARRRGLNLNAGTMALITVLVSLACLATGAGLAILVTRARMHQQRRRDKERAMESKQIKALMYALMSTSDDYQVGLMHVYKQAVGTAHDMPDVPEQLACSCREMPWQVRHSTRVLR